MSKAFVFLADGFEEIEAISPVDILRRGGIDTLTVSVTGRSIVTGAHGIPVAADLLMEAFLAGEAPTEEDALVFPGGLPGAQTLADCRPLIECLRSHEAAGGVCGAICAAPGLVLSQLDTLAGKRFTCYTGFEKALIEKGAVHTGAPAECDGHLVTGRGPGCAVAFGLSLLGRLRGKAVAQAVSDGMLV